MEIKDNMYYGFGQVVYAVAMADGEVQKAELENLKTSIEVIREDHGIDMGITEIIFELLQKNDQLPKEEALQNGIKNFHLGDDYLTSDLAAFFDEVLAVVAHASPPSTTEEEKVITEFKNYLNDRIDSGLKIEE